MAIGLLGLIGDKLKGLIDPTQSAMTGGQTATYTPETSMALTSQAPQGFFDDPERMARIGLALNSMRLKPDDSLAAGFRETLADARQTREAVRKNEALMSQGNRTVQYLLANGMIDEQQAQQMLNNPELAKMAATQLIGKTKQEPETIQTMRLLGLPITPEGMAQFEASKRAPEKPEATPTEIKILERLGLPITMENVLQLKRAGAANVSATANAGAKGDVKWEEEAAKSIAGRFDALVNQGDVSSGMRPAVQQLAQLSQIAPTGPLQGRLAGAFPGFSTAGDAFLATVNQLAPQLRVKGSGATSDKDMDMLVSSMGSLRNAPGANQMVYQAMMDKIALDEQRAQIANDALMGSISRAEASQKLKELNQRTVISPQLREMIAQAGKASASAGETRTWNGTTYRFKGGNRNDKANWEVVQ